MNVHKHLPAPLSDSDPFAHDEPQVEESPLLIFQRLHRLLRGRYLLTFSLALVGALAGAAAGYLLPQPLYQSTGLVHVMSRLPDFGVDTEQSRFDPMFTSYVQTQAAMIMEPRVIEQAMSSEDWRSLGRGLTPSNKTKFKKSLEVSAKREQPEIIIVTFTDPDPIAAQIGLQQTLKAYERIHGKADVELTTGKINFFEQERKDVATRIRTNEEAIRQLTEQYPTSDLAILHEQMVKSQQEVQAQYLATGLELERLRAAIAQAGTPDDFSQDRRSVAQRIAQVDAQMAGLLLNEMQAEADLEMLRERGLGEGHRRMKQAVARHEAAKAATDRYAADYTTNFGPVVNQPVGMAGVPLQTALAQTESAHAALEKQLADLNTQIREIKQLRQRVDAINAELASDRQHLENIDNEIVALRTASQGTQALGMAGRVNIISYGDEPTAPSIDHRKKLAVLGFMLGGGLPVGAMLLIGLLDGRYRYCDDARPESTKMALLGILPYLPDKIGDPEQASVAAHCVHQVRTRLQIAGRDGGHKVFAVTSPTSGDGKTSLSLSLALSFAASGAETLLVDLDLIGAGLTASLQAGADRGVVHAMDTGEFESFVLPGGFARLSILPAGMDDAGEVGRLSPAMVRRLIDQARRRYDVVIIDTGPILGSLEAPLVCAEADGVVVAIGQGQQRTQTERSIDQLRTIGANILGVVFNRARAGDFRRAITSASVRSVPVAPQGSANGHARGHTSAALGPMARTVASAFRS